MSRLKEFTSRLRGLFRYGQLDADMAEEMRLHLELRAERNRSAGMPTDDAHFAAQRDFGGIEQIKEQAREVRNWAWAEALRRDFLYALRMLRRSPLFTAVTVASLALCLGLNAAIYSVLRALVLQPLPFQAAGDIVEIYSSAPKMGLDRLTSNLGQYVDFKANAPALATLALWDIYPDVLTDNNDAAQLVTATVSDEFFGLLGVQPLAGRFFNRENLDPGRDKVLVLTESYWRSRFHSDRSAIGQTLRLNGTPYEIIGIAPKVIEAFDARVKAIRPYTLPPAKLVNPDRISFYVNLLGRIAPGATVADARAQLTRLEKIFYDGLAGNQRSVLDRTGQTIRVEPLMNQRGAPLKVALLLLQVGAMLVLLIGAINVINLFLARGNARQREFQTRAALGASSRDLVRQLSVEAGLIGVCGVAGGLVLAWLALQAANAFTATLLPSALPFGLGPDVIKLTALAGVVLTFVIAALPTARVIRQTSASSSLQVNDRDGSANRRARWVAGSLVVGQVAFALLLLVGAALLVRSFLQVLSQAPGFDPEHVITAKIDVRGDPNHQRALVARVEASLRTVPGFEGCVATAAPFVPVPGYPFSMGHSGTISIADEPAPPGTEWPGVFFCGVSADYARVVGIRMRRGRWFTEADYSNSRVVVVDETFAQRFFPGQDPIGRRIARGKPRTKPEEWPEIIGVAANVRHNGVEDRSGTPFTYFPGGTVRFFEWASILVRTTRPPAEAFTILRGLIREIDPTVPVFAENTLSGALADLSRGRQGIMLTLTGFAGVALLLSAIGVFGVLAYDVSRRTREIGVRVALGASRDQIMGMVVQDGGRKALAGVAIGLLIAVGANRFIASLLFDVAPTDIQSYAGSAALLVMVAVLAAWLPARRAARVDPIVALRCE